jgi:hypothetical protein
MSPTPVAVPQVETPTLEQISQLLDSQLGTAPNVAPTSSPSPYNKPDIDLRPDTTFQPVIQGTPESFAAPIEQPQIIEMAPPAQPQPAPTPAQVPVAPAPEAKPESTTTPEGTPVPAHKNLVPPSEDGVKPAVEPISEDAASSEQTVQPDDTAKLEEGFVKEAQSLAPPDKIDDVNFVHVDKQVSSTGRSVDITKIDQPKRHLNFGVFIAVTVAFIILGIAAFVAYNYVSQNITERVLGCDITSDKDVSSGTPAYSARLTVDLIGKTPKCVSTKYNFIYNNMSEAEDVIPKEMVSMAKKINVDYSGFVGDVSSPVPMVTDNKVTLTLNYSAVEFLNKLIDGDVAHESGDSIIKKVESKMSGLGYTCAMEDM